MALVIRFPVTEAGRTCLRKSIQSGVYRKADQYGQPGGLMDWDEIAASEDEMWESYQRFMGENGR